MTTLNIDLKVNPKNYDFLMRSKKRRNVLYGSAGSGKSWSIAQFLIVEKMLKEHDIRILITRKTGPALRKSCWLLIQDLLKKWGIPYSTNKTDWTLTIGTNEMLFVPLDDPEKLKSIEGINYVWAEEATELTQKDFMQLNIRCRGQNPNGANRLYFSFNPVERPGVKYLKHITECPPENTAVRHSTYKDNFFLTKEYGEELEALMEQDKTYYQIYALGKWALPENIVYTNWVTTKQWPSGMTGHGYGVDFGYNAPCAVVECGFHKGEVYMRELLYERKLTNTELIERLEALVDNRHRPIVADAAEPDRIEEIRQAGFNVYPCSKGPASVKIGIDRVKRFKCNVHWLSTNLQSEFETYKWKEDPDGNSLDVPVAYNDHLMDAMRYYLGEVRCDMPKLINVGNYFGK